MDFASVSRQFTQDLQCASSSAIDTMPASSASGMLTLRSECNRRLHAAEVRFQVVYVRKISPREVQNDERLPSLPTAEMQGAAGPNGANGAGPRGNWESDVLAVTWRGRRREQTSRGEGFTTSSKKERAQTEQARQCAKPRCGSCGTLAPLSKFWSAAYCGAASAARS